ncbi:MAG: hypothetical protein JXA19_03305 [Anaerolineales bacterium]|nr:hypothetical protein [Anaerolineales bacterium]
MNEVQKNPNKYLNYRRTGIIISFFGYLIFLVGAQPGWFGMDRSEVIGYLQIAVFLFGLGLITGGGVLLFSAFWSGRNRSVIFDIGLRLVWTGFVTSLVTGLADVLGLGTRPLGQFIPFFGYWQERGILLGEAVTLIGFLLMIPYYHWKEIRSSHPEDK